jgi:uncharacterized protein YbgA (DUF1722 family)/uncharacterized protein YbbK (DUF523 family)
MKPFVKPRVVISKCIEFEFCRYNSQIICSELVSKLKPHVEFLPICAEVEIGFGVPRDPIRIVEKQHQKRLIQPTTGHDVTDAMKTFIQEYLGSLYDIDGFLLKSQSPSCGTRDVKIYPAVLHSAPVQRAAGFFGGEVLRRFPMLAIEDEMRLNNPVIRHHYLTKIFMLAHFRKVREAKQLRELLRFHTDNKFLLMRYNQKELRILGNILANQDKQQLSSLLSDYQHHLHLALSKAPRYTSEINMLDHAFGYVSQDLSAQEKKFYIDLREKFRQGKIPISVPINLVRSWVLRFQQPYLLTQTFFQPYPDDLLDAETLKASDVRDFWK